MITAFQQGRNCLIISEIFQVMVYTVLSNVGNNENWGWRKKRRLEISAERFSSQASFPESERLKNLHFFKAITSGCKKKIRQDWPTSVHPPTFVCIRGQILLNPSMNLEKQLENLLYNQPVVPGTFCVSTGRPDTPSPGTETRHSHLAAFFLFPQPSMSGPL